MAIEIVDLPIKYGGSFHSYVSLPEGIRVYIYRGVLSHGGTSKSSSRRLL